MKEFIRDVRDGFTGFSDYLLISLFLSFLSYLFFDISEALNCFCILMGIWAVIFIGMPTIVFLLDIINRIFGLEPDKNPKNK